MRLKQVASEERTLIMVDLDQQMYVSGIEIFRHAGDFTEGCTDSWFLNIKAVAYEHGTDVQTARDDQRAVINMDLKSLSEHGINMLKIRTLMENIDDAGYINGHRWNCND